jgi:hypothetical protein
MFGDLALVQRLDFAQERNNSNLRGANLQRYHPAVIITENTPQDALKFALLRDHGYRLHAQLKYDSIWT